MGVDGFEVAAWRRVFTLDMSSMFFACAPSFLSYIAAATWPIVSYLSVEQFLEDKAHRLARCHTAFRFLCDVSFLGLPVASEFALRVVCTSDVWCSMCKLFGELGLKINLTSRDKPRRARTEESSEDRNQGSEVSRRAMSPVCVLYYTNGADMCLTKVTEWKLCKARSVGKVSGSLCLCSPPDFEITSLIGNRLLKSAAAPRHCAPGTPGMHA